MGCTNEKVIENEVLDTVIVDTVVVSDTIINEEVVTDTLQVLRSELRNDAQYIDDAFLISLNHNDLKNENTGDRYRLTVRSFYAAIVGETSWDNRILMRFNDMEFINSSAQIDSAILTLYVYYQDGCNSNDCVPLGNNLLGFYPLVRAWDEQSVTWENQPEWNTEVEVKSTEAIGNSDTYFSIDIAPVVQYWLDEENYGMMIKLLDEDNIDFVEKVVEFYSSDHADEELRPQLTLYYHESN